MNQKCKRRGFTLIELLITIAIISIVAAVASSMCKRLHQQRSEQRD